MRRVPRKDLASCAVLVVLWIAVWLPRLHGPIDLRWDASAYYILGTSLFEGKGYRLLNEPGEIEAVQYPPLLPLVVAAYEKVLGTADYLVVAPRLRLSYFLLSGLYLFAAYALVRFFLMPPYALVVCSLTALSFDSFLHPSDTLYAEMPFALVSALFLVCHRLGHRRGCSIAAGFLGVAATLLRTAGVALLAAWVGESLLRRRFRQASIRIAVAAVPILLWQSHVWRVTSGEDYRRPAYPYQRATYSYSNVSYGVNFQLVDPFRPELGRIGPRKLVERVLENLTAVPAALGQCCWMGPAYPNWFRENARNWFGLELPSYGFFARVVMLLGCAVLAGAGLVAWQGEWFLPLYLAVTIGFVSLTPWPEQFWRYFAPLTPLSALFFLELLRTIGAWCRKRDRAWARAAGSLVIAAPPAVMLIVSIGIAGSFLRNLLPVSYYDARGKEHLYGLLTYGPEWHALDPTFEWLRHHGGAEEMIASSLPHLAYLRSGHRSVLPPMESDPEQARRLLDSVPVTYVVLDQFGISQRYAGPVVRSRPSEWQLVYTAPGGGAEVYERVR